MTSYFVALELRVTPVSPDLGDRLDDVLEALYEMDGVQDVDYGASLASGEVEFTGYVDTDSLDDAARRFSTAVRAAIHAAEGNTAGWPVFDERGHVRVEAPEPTTA
jgi:hypothetical protein